MNGDKEKVMRFLVENMKEDAKLMAEGNANPPPVAETNKFTRDFKVKSVTEQQMICNFVRHCGIGRGAGWTGLIIMPTSAILKYVRDIVHDALHLQLHLGDVVMTQTANNTIVVKWQTGEELRLEACHCAIALQHVRGRYFQYLGFIHMDELSERTRLVARTSIIPYKEGDEVVIYES